MPELKSMFEN